MRFKTVTPKQTKPYMEKLIKLYSQCLEEETIHPLIILAAFNLDFLCIHPFRDGNGRVSRLLFLLQCYHHGYDVGRYISIERLIEENKERYYETLEQSSVGWHEGKHDPWPYINYLLFILKSVYKDFETQLGKIKSPRGAKTQMIEAAIDTFGSSFTLSQIESACPGVSRDMIRRTLRNLQKKGDVECLGRGPGAEWCKRGNTLKKGQ
ncbi:MAG: Fic family protein [Acidobacteriota bacterium]